MHSVQVEVHKARREEFNSQMEDGHTFSEQGASKGDPLGQVGWVGLHASRQ